MHDDPLSFLLIREKSWGIQSLGGSFGIVSGGGKRGLVLGLLNSSALLSCWEKWFHEVTIRFAGMPLFL